MRACAYRDGVRIGATTISSGKRGYETPIGALTVLQADKDRYSKTYHRAPMPCRLAVINPARPGPVVSSSSRASYPLSQPLSLAFAAKPA